MRKLLYATTALTAAALIAGAAGEAAAQTLQQTGASPSPYREQLPANPPMTVPAPPPPAYVSKSAERIKLGLSGYFQQWGVYTPQSYKARTAPTGAPALGGQKRNIQTNDVGQKHNSEICVIGQTTLDSGLTVGINVQFEANTENDTIDESYLFLQSPTMGQVILGDENNAGYLLHVTAPDGGVSLDSGDLCNLRAFETGGSGTSPGGGAQLFDTTLCTTNLRLLDNDSGKFTYITPRFAGLQAGVSYIPEFQNGGDNNSTLKGNNYFDSSTNSGQTRGINNGVAGGLNYTNTFGGLGVQGSGGVLWAKTGKSQQGTSQFTNNKDLLAYNAGAQFSFAGFSVGGGWMWVPQGSRPVIANGATAVNQKMNGMGWTAGTAYEFGPYKVGLDYETGTNNKTSGGGKDRLDQAVLSGTYTMGPGIRLVGGVFYYDWQEENQNSENHGIGALTGIKLAF